MYRYNVNVYLDQYTFEETETKLLVYVLFSKYSKFHGF